MKYDFTLRSIIIAFNQPSGLMNFTNFMEGLLPFFSTGFAPGRIYGSTIFVHCSCLTACTCQFGPGTITVLGYKACKSLVEAAVRAYK